MFFQEAVAQGDAMPGAVIATQTFGDFWGFNPHCRVLCTDGCLSDYINRSPGRAFTPSQLRDQGVKISF